MDALLTSQEEEASVPHLRVGRDEKGLPTFGIEGASPEHGKAQLARVFGTTSDDFARAQLEGLFTGLSTALGRPPTEFDLNAAIVFVHGIRPTNEVEAALAVQMAIVHAASLRLAGRLNKTDPLLHDFDSAGRMAFRFMKLFAEQAQALARLRGPPTQIIRVERLTVTEGGQAFVGMKTS